MYEVSNARRRSPKHLCHEFATCIWPFAKLQRANMTAELRGQSILHETILRYDTRFPDFPPNNTRLYSRNYISTRWYKCEIIVWINFFRRIIEKGFIYLDFFFHDDSKNYFIPIIKGIHSSRQFLFFSKSQTKSCVINSKGWKTRILANNFACDFCTANNRPPIADDM